MARVAGKRIQQVRKDPFVDLMPSARGQIDKANTTLPRGPGPANLTGSFDAHARRSQIKVQSDSLLQMQRRNRLHSHTFMTEIADDSAVGLVEGNVG